jgi:hypothetical protein
MDNKTLTQLLRLGSRYIDEAISILESETTPEIEAVTQPTNGSTTAAWHEVDRLPDESWTWPDGNFDTYSEIVVYEGSGNFAGAKLGLGYQNGPGKEGEVNGFVFASGGSSKRPLTVFFPAGDFESTHELVSMIRGRDGSRKTFGPTDSLPAVYHGFKTDILGKRIEGKWNVQAVVAKEDDAQTMLNHTALQARLRGLI